MLRDTAAMGAGRAGGRVRVGVLTVRAKAPTARINQVVWAEHPAYAEYSVRQCHV